MRQKPCVRLLPVLEDTRGSIDGVNNVQVATCDVGIGAESRGRCAKCDVVHLLERCEEAWWPESRMDRVAVGSM